MSSKKILQPSHPRDPPTASFPSNSVAKPRKTTHPATQGGARPFLTKAKRYLLDDYVSGKAHMLSPTPEDRLRLKLLSVLTSGLVEQDGARCKDRP
jgi:hypothetical protein